MNDAVGPDGNMNPHGAFDLPLETSLIGYLTANEDLPTEAKTVKQTPSRFHFARTTPSSPVPAKASRLTASRPQSPKPLEKDSSACISRMRSPLSHSVRPLKRESQDKQLDQWRERAQVWAREKQALERRIERLLLSQDSTNLKDTAHFTSSKDLIIARQEAKIIEQTCTIKSLREEITRSQGSDGPVRRSLIRRRENDELRETNAALAAKVGELQREVAALTLSRTEAVRQLTTAGVAERVLFAEVAALKQEIMALRRLTEEVNSDPTSAATSVFEDSGVCFAGEKFADCSDDLVRRLEVDQREKRIAIGELCEKLQKSETERTTLVETCAALQGREETLRTKVRNLETELDAKYCAYNSLHKDFGIMKETAEQQKSAIETLSATLSETQEKLIETVKEMTKLEEKLGAVMKDNCELQQHNSSLSSALQQAKNDLSELRLVLEGSSDPHLESVDDRFQAFLEYVGPGFGEIVRKFEKEIETLEEKLRYTKEVCEDKVETMAIQMEAVQAAKLAPLKIPVIPRTRAPSTTLSTDLIVTYMQAFLTCQAQAIEELIN